MLMRTDKNEINVDTLQSNNKYNVAFDNIVVNGFHVVTCRKNAEGIFGGMAW